MTPYPNPTRRDRLALEPGDVERHVYAQPLEGVTLFRPWDLEKEYSETWPERVPPQFVTFGCPPPKVLAPGRFAVAAVTIAISAALVFVDVVVCWAFCSMYAARVRELVG